jgi:hypothetical protein
VKGTGKIIYLSHSVTIEKAKCLYKSKGSPFKMAKCIKDAHEKVIKKAVEIGKYIENCVKDCEDKYDPCKKYVSPFVDWA